MSTEINQVPSRNPFNMRKDTNSTPQSLPALQGQAKWVPVQCSDSSMILMCILNMVGAV